MHRSIEGQRTEGLLQASRKGAGGEVAGDVLFVESVLNLVGDLVCSVTSWRSQKIVSVIVVIVPSVTTSI